MRFLCSFLLLFCLETNAQTRLFFSLGTNVSTEFTGGPNLHLGLANNSFSLGSFAKDNSMGRYLRLDLTMENRLSGSYYWLIGITIHQTGYRYAQSVYTSNLKNTYLSIPLLARINLYNANTVYLDFGFMQNFLLNANLKESFFDISDHQNIASHLSRLSTCFYFELSYAYRQVSLGLFFQSKAFGTSSNFSSEWGLDYNRSVFLLYYQSFYFKSSGIKLTYRLR